MTSATAPALHDVPQLVVGDLVFKVASPRQRKTIEITVERDASLVLKAPPAVTIERATRFVAAKRQWVYRKLVEKDALTGPPVVKKFVEGEGFAYLGRSHRLTLTPEGTGVRLHRGRFHLPTAEAHQGAAAMRCWYTEVGSKWLQNRSRSWAARLGEQSVTVEVRDLGYRWGSARPHTGPPTHTHPLGHPPTAPKPHRLHSRARTRPPTRSQPHPHILVHRRTPNARIGVAPFLWTFFGLRV